MAPRIEDRPSPNSGPRKNGWSRPELIVLHYTAMDGGAEPAIKRLCMPETEVSAHYVIGPDGAVFRLVPEELRAWHAGAGRWGDCWDLNSKSIGIELANDGISPFAARQMDALEALMGAVMARHGIGPEAVIGHSDSAPGRKADPGGRFDWRRLARAGLAIWPESRPGDAPCRDGFRRQARIAGYTAQVDDDTLLEAVRLRFRPGAEGPLAAADMAVVSELAARWPVAPSDPPARPEPTRHRRERRAVPADTPPELLHEADDTHADAPALERAAAARG